MTDRKRILVLAATAGLGHWRAAEAITAVLEREYSEVCDVQLINPLEDERAPQVLRDTQDDYDRMVRDTPDFYQFAYDVSDAAVPTSMLEGALVGILFTLMRDLLKRHAPDAIVSTYPIYEAPIGAARLTGGPDVPLVTVVTDFVSVHRIWFPNFADTYMVATAMARDVAEQAGIPADKIKVTGIPVDPAIAEERREPAAIRAQLGWETGMTTALVVGGKRVGNLPEILQALDHTNLPLQLVVLAGGDDELYQRLQEVKWHSTVQRYNFVDNMPTLMHASDLMLCKAGGLIVSEALACGLPMVLVDVLPGQEAGNAEFVVAHGAGELGQSPVTALETVYHWLDREGALLAERAANARALGRPRAAHEIARHVLELAGGDAGDSA